MYGAEEMIVWLCRRLGVVGNTGQNTRLVPSGGGGGRTVVNILLLFMFIQLPHFTPSGKLLAIV